MYIFFLQPNGLYLSFYVSFLTDHVLQRVKSAVLGLEFTWKRQFTRNSSDVVLSVLKGERLEILIKKESSKDHR